MTMQPATRKQAELIARLETERTVPVAGRDSAEAWLIARYEDMMEVAYAMENGMDVAEHCRFVSIGEASKVIDWMLGLPRQAVRA